MKKVFEMKAKCVGCGIETTMCGFRNVPGRQRRALEGLGRELLETRNRLGMSLRDVEKESGINNAVLSGIERGKDFRVSTAHELIVWLDSKN